MRNNGKNQNDIACDKIKRYSFISTDAQYSAKHMSLLK